MYYLFIWKKETFGVPALAFQGVKAEKGKWQWWHVWVGSPFTFPNSKYFDKGFWVLNKRKKRLCCVVSLWNEDKESNSNTNQRHEIEERRINALQWRFFCLMDGETILCVYPFHTITITKYLCFKNLSRDGYYHTPLL